MHHLENLLMNKWKTRAKTYSSSLIFVWMRSEKFSAILNSVRLLRWLEMLHKCLLHPRGLFKIPTISLSLLALTSIIYLSSSHLLKFLKFMLRSSLKLKSTKCKPPYTISITLSPISTLKSTSLLLTLSKNTSHSK